MDKLKVKLLRSQTSSWYWIRSKKLLDRSYNNKLNRLSEKQFKAFAQVRQNDWLTKLPKLYMQITIIKDVVKFMGASHFVAGEGGGVAMTLFVLYGANCV